MDKKILCIIPARSGSKGIPHKNIKEYNGKPLLGWSIVQAKESKYVSRMRIIVSTDSMEYKQVALEYGAEVPFLRPSEIAQDLSPCSYFIKHTLDWLSEKENYVPDVVIHLRPTQPMRKTEDIDKCLDIFLNNMTEYDSLRTVIPLDKTPYKTYSIEDNILIPLVPAYNGISEPFNQARQIFPQCYIHNGYIDIIKASIVTEDIISGTKIYPYVMSPEDKHDIDTPQDFADMVNS
jgi:N-acylneuraminate cytidylyltransferase